MSRASSRGLLVIIILLAVLILISGMQFERSEKAYALTEGDWQDFASEELELLDSGQDNSESNPYLINSPEDLACLALKVNSGQTFNGGYFLQTQDIDLGAHYFMPIGYGTAFEGVYDGDRKKINNLIIDLPQNSFPVGLFGFVSQSGVLKNININSGTICASNNVGSIVGDFSGSLIENCISSAHICQGESIIQYVGGIAGFNNGKISKSYFLGAIYADLGQSVGGVAGSNGISGMIPNLDYGVVENCFNAAPIEGRLYVGGIAGENYGLIQNIYNSGHITSEQYTGGIVGDNFGEVKSGYSIGLLDTDINYNGALIGRNTGEAQNLYFNTDTPNDFYNYGALGQENQSIHNAINDAENDVLPLSYFQMISPFAAMDLQEGHWEYPLASKDIGFTPYLSCFGDETKVYSSIQLFGGDKDSPDWGAQEPFLIDNAFQFVFLSNAINHNNISYAGNCFELSSDVNFSILNSIDVQFEPIGTVENPFSGSIEGNSYTLKNLTINTNDSHTALFAYNSGIIKNLTIENFAIRGGDYTAALIAINNSDIENICLIGCDIEGKDFVGGLIAQNQSGEILNISSVDSLIQGSVNVGGIVGQSSNQQSVFECLTSNSTVQAIENVGGLIGLIDDGLSLSLSYFIGDIQGENNIGGLIGFGEEEVLLSKNFVFSNEISGVDSIGGLAGYLGADCEITSSYVRADIKGIDFVGGLLGRSTTIMISDSYFVGEIDFQTNGAAIANSNLILDRVYYNKDFLNDEDLNYSGEGKTSVELSRNIDLGTDFIYEASDGLYGYYPQIGYHADTNIDVSKESTIVYYFEKGNGSVASPYRISKSLHLFNMKRLIDDAYDDYSDKYYELGEDIVLEWDFAPIASFENPFMGRFNGRYYSIYNLTINLPETDYVGLFSAIGVGARIEKLNIRPLVVSSEEIYGSVVGKDFVGALVGYSEGYIWDCMNNTDVRGHDYVGGLAGRSSNISRSFNTAAITGEYNVGGLAGKNDGNMDLSFNSGYIKVNISNGGGLTANNYGTVEYCYNSGNIESELYLGAFTGDMKGGLVGINQSGATLRNSYNIGRISGQASMTGGGIVAYNLSDEAVSHCYFNKEIISDFEAIGSGNLYSDNVLGLSTIEMVGVDALNNIDIPGAYFISQEERGMDADYSPQLVEFYDKQVSLNENALIVEIIHSYSKQSVMLRLFGRDVYNLMEWGSADNPYLISTYDHLDTLSMQVADGYTFENCYFLVTQDIEIQPDFLSIGRYDILQPTESLVFNGVFDGNGYLISDLFIGSLDSQYSQGLFGYTGANAVIKNVVISSGEVLGTEKVGSIVGYSLGQVLRCQSSANVRGSSNVGGIIGQLKSNEARHIVFDGNVLGDSNWGGLIGRFEDSFAGIFNGWFVVDIEELYHHNNIGSVLYVDKNGLVFPALDMTATIDKDIIYFEFQPVSGFGFDIRNINDVSIKFNEGGLIGNRYYPMYNNEAHTGSLVRWYARFTKSVIIGDLVNGEATGAGEYYEGQTVRIVIYPDLGYRLVLDTEFFHNYSGDGETIVAETIMGSEAWEFNALFVPFGVGNEVINPLGDPATLDQDKFIYDGEPKNYTINVSGAFTYSVDYFIQQYNILTESAIDAEIYRMELRLYQSGYAVGAKFYTFEILPRKLELDLNLLQSEQYTVKQYDRSSSDNIVIDNSAIIGIVGADEIHLSAIRTFYNQEYEPDRNIGENKLITFNSYTIQGPNAKNYEVPDEYSDIAGRIIKRNAYISILEQYLTKQYDGNEPYISAHSFEGVFGDDGLFVNEFSFTRVDGTPIENWDVGEYIVGLTDDISGNMENYNIMFKKEYIFTITPRIIESVTFSGYRNLYYTGESLNSRITASFNISLGVDGFAQLIFYKNNEIVEECLDAGDYIVKAVINDDNFILTKEQSVSFTVSKIQQSTPLVLADIEDTTYQTQQIPLSAVGGDGSGDIVYEVISGKASTQGNILYINGTGDISIRAKKLESLNYYEQYSNIVTFNVQKGVLQAQISDTYVSYGMIPQIQISYLGYLRGESSKDEVEGLTEPEILVDNLRLADAAGLEVNLDGYPISLRDNGSSDGYIIDVSEASALLFIEKRQIHIAANAISKLYGEEDPELTYTIMEGEDIVLQGSLSRISGERAGKYLIEQNTLNSENNRNYEIVYIPEHFTIYPRDLRVSIPIYTKTYGSPDPVPEFLVNEQDLRLGDNKSVLTGIITRQPGEDVGQYPYSYSSVSAGENYAIVFTEIRYLRIEKAYPYFIREPYSKPITYGQTLAESEILGEANIDGEFVWETPSAMPEVVNSPFFAKFKPADTLNYNSIDFILEVTVLPKKINISFIGSRVHIYDGKDKANLSAKALNTLENDEVLVSLTYSQDSLIDAGTYEVFATIDNENYVIEGEGKSEIIIYKKELEVRLKDAEILQGDDYQPEFEYRGFVEGEDIGVLIKEPFVNVPTQPGRHKIVPQGAQAKNYVFTYKPAFLTINKKEFLSSDNKINLIGSIPFNFTANLVSLSQDSSEFVNLSNVIEEAVLATDYKNYRLSSYHKIESPKIDREITYKIYMDDPGDLPLVLYYSNGAIEVVNNYKYEEGFVVFDAINVVGVGVLREAEFLEAYGEYMLYGGIALAAALLATLLGILIKRAKKKTKNTRPRFYH